MASFEIPLSPLPQSFSIDLDATSYKLTVGYNRIGAYWALNIDDQQGIPIVHGIALVTGADLLEQFRYLGFTGALVCQSDGNADDIPTVDNLGQEGRVFYISFL